MKDNGFKVEKERRNPAHTIIDANYADDIALLANTPAQAEFQLHSLEQEAFGIGLHVNADDMEYMCSNEKDDISTLNGRSLKPMNKFAYQGSSVSSTEKDINTRLANALTVVDRLSVMLKSDLTDKIRSCRYYYMDALHGR